MQDQGWTAEPELAFAVWHDPQVIHTHPGASKTPRSGMTVNLKLDSTSGRPVGRAGENRLLGSTVSVSRCMSTGDGPKALPCWQVLLQRWCCVGQLHGENNCFRRSLFLLTVLTSFLHVKLPYQPSSLHPLVPILIVYDSSLWGGPLVPLP